MKRYNEARLREEMRRWGPDSESVNSSFIKAYTDHQKMVEILEKIQTDYPDIADMQENIQYNIMALIRT